MLLGLLRVVQQPAIDLLTDCVRVTAAGEAITMWARVVLPAYGAGWPSPKSQHGLGRQEGLMS